MEHVLAMIQAYTGIGIWLDYWFGRCWRLYRYRHHV